MADGTRFARVEESLAKLTTLQENQAVSIAQQSSNIDSLTSAIKELNIGLQTLDAKVEQSIRRFSVQDPNAQTVVPPPSQSPLGHANMIETCQPLKSMRLEVPRFSGENPLAWISRIQRYFDFYMTPDPQRLTIASFHLDGDALDWYDWMNRSKLITNWTEFLEAVERQFGPSEYEDHLGTMSKLMQVGKLGEYQHQFEQLATKIPNVPESVLVSCFISGLRPDLRRETQVYKPQSLKKAMGLARLFDDKATDNKNQIRSGIDHSRYEKSFGQSRASALPPLLPTPSAMGSNAQLNRPKPMVNFRKLTPIEMAARLEKGLCYNCDEKYSFGHRCKAKMFFFIGEEGESALEEWTDMPPPPDILSELSEISLHAMAGQLSPRTLRMQGQVAGMSVQTLIDGGSTHNFIQERIARFLKLPIVPSPHFQVLVGNGQSLVCDGYCPQVLITLGQERFLIDFYVLKLQGADVVLGVQWLELLGTITIDYRALYMEFDWEGRRVHLQGEPLLQLQQVHFNQLRRMDKTEAISTCFQLLSLRADFLKQSEVPSNCAKLLTLLDMYSDVFAEPTSLPPHRLLDHKIHLVPQACPVNVKPYSHTFEDHLYHLELVLHCLRKHSFYANRSKCSFGTTSINYLGHIVSATGVEPDPSKIEAITSWPLPTTLKALRGFLGLTGFYRKFVQSYAHIATPLTDLLKKDKYFWSPEVQSAFETLKSALTQTPILALPNFSVPFQIQTDASGTGLGAVLLQEN
ncbi:uncharacterized protein [Henckelia pumila]|uniref:uncharacterized protein n=1 Tax=Henckelia pumila TaxID=405737 RepID=UPI003C6DFEB3